MSRQRPVQESISYPTVAATPTFNPCDHKISLFEHLLCCGHLVTTSEPDEPCAPNCHRVAHKDNATAKQKMLDDMEMQKGFYCNACIEEGIEQEIPDNLSSKAAEQHRIRIREIKAADQQKATKYRKCYIAQKIVAVPCDKEGNTIRHYDPLINVHPYDTAWPPTGANMFEDIEVTPQKSKKSKRVKLFSSAESSPVSLDASDGDASNADEELAEDIEETLAEGARWLDEQEDLARRRAEDATLSPRRRRAAARPVNVSSSPGPAPSSPSQQERTMVPTSPLTPRSPVIPQGSPRISTSPLSGLVPIPQGPTKEGHGKRRRKAPDEAVIAPVARPAKQAKTPKAARISGSKKSIRSSSAAVLPAKTIRTSRSAHLKESTSSIVPSAMKTKSTGQSAAAEPSRKQSKQSCNVL